MANTAPLQGVVVLEFCQVAAGPFCGMLLADMGADVVKIEGPDGDPMREWPPFNNGFSENFASLNRNKRSVQIDLKDAHGVSCAKQLISRSDVIIENNRPGVMKRLGLGYEELSTDKPNLIYCSMSAYGQSGPRTTEAGFDLTIQGIAGIMSVTGDPQGDPVKCGVPISDFSTGLYAAYAIACSVSDVRNGGHGTHIDVSMLGATLGIAALQTSEYFGTDRDPGRLGSAHPRNAPYEAFRAKDEHFVLAAGNDSLWMRLCKAIGRDDLLKDSRFLTTELRAKHQEALREILNAYFSTRNLVDIISMLSAHGIPCGPINPYSKALADPQVKHMGWVKTLELPGGGLTKTFGFPVSMSGECAEIRHRPPALGEHTDEVLQQIDVPRRRVGE